MRNIGILDFYYKLEDKWFDFLDFLESKRIPVYKIVDPIEKAGIPSLPVFIAIVLILLYFLFGGISLGGAPAQTFSVSIVDGESYQCIPGAYVKIYRNGGIAFEGTMSCPHEIELPPGDYTIEVQAPDCETVTNFPLHVEEGIYSLSIPMECTSLGLESLVHVCFEQEDIGAVNVIVKKNGVYEKTIFDCGNDPCSFSMNIEGGYTYKFETSEDFESESEYSPDQLELLETSGTCITLEEPFDDRPKGDVTVIVKDKDENPLAGLLVELVRPNSSFVHTDTYTGWTGNYTGKAIFTEELVIGTLFQVKVSGGNNSASKTFDRIYNITEVPLLIEVTLDPAADTTIKVQEQTAAGFVGLAGVYVSAIDSLNEIANSGTTDALGEIVLGLDEGVHYTGTFWKHEYKYVTDEIVGGQDKIITMEKVREQDVGTIIAYVVFVDTGEIVPGAQLTLKFKDDLIPTGIPSELGETNDEGIDRFLSVPPSDNYCIVVSRESGDSDCLDIPEVIAGGEIDAVLEVQPNTFKFKVKVTLDGEIIRYDPTPSVKIYNYDGSEISGSPQNTNKVTGKAIFDVPEYSNINVVVEYRKDGITYDTSEYVGDIETYFSTVGDTLEIELTALDNKVYFNGLVEAVDSLEIGNTYHFKFEVKLKEANNEAWEEVKLTLKDDDNIFDFGEPEAEDFVSFERGTSGELIIIIGSAYHNYGRTAISFTVPARVRAVFSEDMEHSFEYWAEWNKGEVQLKDPTTGTHSTPEYDLTAKHCVLTDDGQFGVCRYFKIGTLGGSLVNSNNPSVDVEEQFTLGVIITNEGGSDFTGSFALDDSEKSILFEQQFNLTLLKSTGPEELRYPQDWTYSSHKIETSSDIQLKHGESILIEVGSSAISPPLGIIKIESNSETLKYNDNDIQFYINIGGEIEVDIYINQTALFDLSNILSFNITERTIDKKPVETFRIQDYVEIEGLTCEISNIRPNPIGTITSDGINVQIKFTETCRLVKNQPVTITIDDAPYIRHASETRDVDECFTIPSITQPMVQDADPDVCQINFLTGDAPDFSYDGEYCTSGNEVDLTMKIEEGCPADGFELTKAIVVEGSPHYVVLHSDHILYNYMTQLVGASSTSGRIEVNISGESRDLTNPTKKLKANYFVTISILVSSSEPPEEAIDMFVPLPIQKYNEEMKCGEKWCNLDQMFKYTENMLDGKEGSLGFTVFLVNSPFMGPGIEDIWENVLGADVAPQEDCDGGYCRNPDIISPSIYVDEVRFRKSPERTYLEKFEGRIPTSGEARDRIVTSTGVQLYMPVIDTGGDLSTEVIKKMSTDIIVKQDASADESDLKSAMKSALATMWGVSTTNLYIDNDGATHQVIIDYCNKEGVEWDDALGDPASSCSIFHTFTNSSPNYKVTDAAIISGTKPDGGRVVYIIGTNKGNVTDIINRFKRTLEGDIGQLRVMINPINGYIYLTKPSPKLRYYCIEESAKCDSIEGELETQLRKIGEKVTGHPAADIELEESTSPEVLIGICEDKGNCYSEGVGGAALFERALSVIGASIDFNIPEGGILVKDTSPASTPLYQIYAPDKEAAAVLIDAYLTEMILTHPSDSSLKYSKEEKYSYGYKEMTLNEFNEFLATNGVDVADASVDFISATIKVTSNPEDCFISLGDIDGEIVDENGGGLSIRYVNTYFFTIKQSDSEFKVHVFKVSGSGSTSGTDKCFASVQSADSFIYTPWADPKGYGTGMHGGPACGRQLLGCGGPLTSCTSPAIEEGYGWGCKNCFDPLQCYPEHTCLTYSNGKGCWQNPLSTCDSGRPNNPGFGMCSSCFYKYAPYFWTSDGRCHSEAETSPLTCASSNACPSTHFCSLDGKCLPKLEEGNTCVIPIDGASHRKSTCISGKAKIDQSVWCICE